nr:hypothetical protein [Natranaerobius trueperi]
MIVKKTTEPVLLTITERKTRKEIIRKIPAKTTEAVQETLANLAYEISDSFSKVFKSFTADNDLEFADLASLEKLVTPKFTLHILTLLEKEELTNNITA